MPTEDTSAFKLIIFLFVIYQADRRHFRHEIKRICICHRRPSHLEIAFVIYRPTEDIPDSKLNYSLIYLSFIKPTEDTSDSKSNVFVSVIYQTNRRHFHLEITFVILYRRHFRLKVKLFSSTCYFSGRQKTFPTRNLISSH